MFKPKPVLTSDLVVIVSTGGFQGYWGKGATLTEAIDNMAKEAGRRPREYRVYVGHKDTRVDDTGGFVFPAGVQPKLIHHQKPKATGAKKGSKNGR